MVCLDNFAPFFLVSCYYLALSLPPFSIFLLEIVGSSPLLHYSFILLGRFIVADDFDYVCLDKGKERLVNVVEDSKPNAETSHVQHFKQ